MTNANSIERLAGAIGYPDRIPDGAVSFTFRVDGAEILSEEADGRLILSCVLAEDESPLPTLAGYAAGRMLKEDAVLAYGDGKALLWQDAPADADPHALLRLFETFMDSCDWWRERARALRGGDAEGAHAAESMVIRP